MQCNSWMKSSHVRCPFHLGGKVYRVLLLLLLPLRLLHRLSV